METQQLRASADKGFKTCDLNPKPIKEFFIVLQI